MRIGHPAGLGIAPGDPLPPELAATPCHRYPAILAIATGHGVIQHRLYRDSQLIVAEAVPSLQPDKHCEGMFPVATPFDQQD